MGCGQIGKTPLGGGYWQCYNGNVWETVPGVQVEPMTAKEVKVARMESQKRIQAEKMELKDCPGFIMKGVAGKHNQEQLNGAYVRIPGVMKNGRPVFAFVGKDKCWGNPDMVIFYDEDGRWRACSKGKHMDAGNDTCYMMGVGHRRLVPLGDEGKWQTYNNGKWTFIDGTKSLPLTGKELEDAKRKLYAKRINFGMKSHSSDDSGSDDDEVLLDDDFSSDGEDPAGS